MVEDREELGIEEEKAVQADVPPAEEAPAEIDEVVEETEEEQEIAARTAVLMDPKYSWFVVNTYSGSEETAKATLLERIGRAGLEEMFGEIVIPKTTVEKVLKSGKRKKVDKTSFPGYMLIQMTMNDRTMGCVTGTSKVTGFVGNQKNPRPMPAKDVLGLMNPDVAKKEVVSTGLTFDKGETIKVTDGPFTNFDGVVEEVKPDKMKLKILVSIFGRETPVELGYDQVEKLS